VIATLFCSEHTLCICFRISEIHRLFTHLGGIINCFLLEMLHFSGTAISVIVRNCMSFFVISFVVYFPETSIFT